MESESQVRMELVKHKHSCPMASGEPGHHCNLPLETCMCVLSGLIGSSMLLLQWFCLFVFRLPDFHGANRRQWLKSIPFIDTGLKLMYRGRDPAPSLRPGTLGWSFHSCQHRDTAG